jgi:hypothetical protein
MIDTRDDVEWLVDQFLVIEFRPIGENERARK